MSIKESDYDSMDALFRYLKRGCVFPGWDLRVGKEKEILWSISMLCFLTFFRCVGKE